MMTLTLILAGCAPKAETVKSVLTTAAFKERMIAHGATVVEGVPSDMTQSIFEDETFGLMNRYYAQNDKLKFLVTYSEFETSQEAQAYLVMLVLFLTNKLDNTFDKENPGKCSGCDKEGIKDYDVYTSKKTGSEIRYIRHENILISIDIYFMKMDVEGVTDWLGY